MIFVFLVNRRVVSFSVVESPPCAQGAEGEEGLDCFFLKNAVI